ncbi:MAG: peptidoglycan DD-metalloendopeptidase family protein [Vibrionaceae bacterium]
MQKKKFSSAIASWPATICVAFTFAFLQQDAYAEPSAVNLSNVKKEIRREQAQLESSSDKLTLLQSELKEQEQAINQFIQDIRLLDRRLAEIQKTIDKLTREHTQLAQSKSVQLKQLSELVNHQYRQDNNDGGMSAIFTGQGDKLDRMSVYAQRLSKARSDTIYHLETTQTSLALKQQQLSYEAQQQTVMREKLSEQKDQLLKTQQSKKEVAQAIRQKINSNRNRISELKENERQLITELKLAQEMQLRRAQELEMQRLAQQKLALEQQQQQQQQLQEQQEQEQKALESQAQAAEVAMTGIGALKGRLRWPVHGKILHSFGSQQSGQLRWNGVVISAKEGTEIKAVHDGTIVLSNWLRGYGLMMVIDHGKGDMSFYGYNQALLKKVGETVKAGEAIALAGNSGGQAESGLYFEIRRKGDTINPTPWLAKR